MKTYPYNRRSVEGRRLYNLLDSQYNPGAPDAAHNARTFDSYDVPSVAHCRANHVGFIFSSNLSGLKRPQIHIDADIEMAWGEFSDDVDTLDFTHGEELPFTYIEPLDDETLKMLIDAGLYSDPRFEELMSKLMADEVFDAEAEMGITYLDVGESDLGEVIPVVLVDPVHVVHDATVESEHATASNLVRRSALLAIELQKEGVKSEDLVATSEVTQDTEVFIPEDFKDIIAQKEEEALEAKVSGTPDISTDSELLDAEIDVTDELKGSLGFDHTSEDDRIRDLKEQERESELEGIDIPDAIDYGESPHADVSDIADIDDDISYDAEASDAYTIDDSAFDGMSDIDSYTIDDDDEPAKKEDEDELER